MDDASIEKLVVKLEDAVVKSHHALAKTYSNQQGEIILRLDRIEDQQRIANGRTAKNEEDIKNLQLTNASEEGEKKIVGKVSVAFWALVSGVIGAGLTKFFFGK